MTGIRTTGNRLGTLVLAAYRNERALDQRYRALNPDCDSVLRGLPDFKPMALQLLRKRLGRWTYALLLLAAMAFAVRNLFGLVRLIGRREPIKSGAFMVATIPSNRALIQMAARQAPDGSHSHRPMEVGFGERLRSLDLRDRLAIVVAMICVYRLLLARSGERLSLGLHARDCFGMLVLAAFAEKARNVDIWTEDHYQRWAFVLSHAACRLRVVQHGLLDGGIEFVEAFGKINSIGLRSETSLDMFNRYFDVKSHFVFANEMNFDDLGYRNILLLASSAPYIDAEIELLTALRGHISLEIAIKLHPAHRYDARADRLAALADVVVPADKRPQAAAFVSWNSFMEFDYEAAGVATWSMERCGGADATAHAIIAELKVKAADLNGAA